MDKKDFDNEKVLTPVKLDMPMLASRFTFLDGSGCVVRIKL